MGFLDHVTRLGITGAALGATIPAFGGEDPLVEGPAPQNWHHEGLTRQAADAAGWWAEAQNALAFHTDYVDSYLYNPLWWLNVTKGGGPDRLAVALSSQVDLKTVHFDDLFQPEAVRAMWRRYLSGTAAGLIWLGGNESQPIDRRVAMAQNLVGTSLHAIQDFYSHSNWIDDDHLRSQTWFEVDPDLRACLSLWTGSYEQPEHLGILPHGVFVYACGVINRFGSAGRGLLNAVCHAASPFAGSSLCRWFKQCENSQPLQQPPSVGGVPLPEDVLWVEPGINVDNRWLAEEGVKTRGLSPRISGGEAFEAAYELAYRSSCQWLHILEQHVMVDAGLGEFFDKVKCGGVVEDLYETPTAPWEDFAQLPYRFISAGPYPPQGRDDTADWYLRLLIRTAGDTFAGTNADIVPFVNGQRFPILDHGIPPSPPEPGKPAVRTEDQSLMGHDDFEGGDVAAYMIGPLDQEPRTVTLLNDAPDAGDLIRAAINGLGRALDSAVEFVRGLWGYDADFVGRAHWTIPAADLDTLGAGSRRPFYLSCDGLSEGTFGVSGYVEGTSETGTFANGVAWRRFRVYFENLHCIKESEWDRWFSDEPFVLGLVIPHGGPQPMIAWRTEPYGNVNTGDVNPIGRPPFTVVVPKRYGFISVACAVYESDDETPNDRDALLTKFAGTVGGGIVEAEDTFMEVLGESIAAGWKLASIEAVAFRRSPTVEVRAYEPKTFDQWLEGGHQVDWTLTQSSTSSIAVPDTLACGHDACTRDVEFPPKESDGERIDLRRKPGDGGETPPDDGSETLIDLADLDPRCRPRFDPDDPGFVVDEPIPPPKPKDGC